jgi:hypothetical protein
MKEEKQINKRRTLLYKYSKGNERHKQDINESKTYALQKYKEREQEHDLDLKTKMPKCMANASFYRPKFRTIELMTNC